MNLMLLQLLLSASVLFTTMDLTDGNNSKEEEQFWNRFLVGSESSLSLPLKPTFSPTLSPVAAPTTKPPQTMKSPKPTTAPTIAAIAPTFSPTIVEIAPTMSPTTAPTTALTKTPTKASSVAPTKKPRNPPTVAPTSGPCEIELELSCVTVEGLPCDKIPFPPTDCIKDVGLLSLTFQYLNATCDESSNDQGINAFCSDFQGLEEKSRVQCIDERGQPLTVLNPTISFGDFFTVSNPNGGLLPNQTDCTVINANNQKVQQNVIDSSGKSPIRPGDKFGSFQLATCGETDCIERIVYFINVTNPFATDLTITLLDFTFQDEDTIDLLPSIDTLLEGGESIGVTTPVRRLNVCSDEEFVSTVFSEGETDTGGRCQDSIQEFL